MKKHYYIIDVYFNEMFVFVQQFIDLFLNVNLKIAIFHYRDISLFWISIIDDDKLVTINQFHKLLIKKCTIHNRYKKTIENCWYYIDLQRYRINIEHENFIEIFDVDDYFIFAFWWFVWYVDCFSNYET